MNVITAKNPKDIKKLIPVILEWKRTCNGKAMNINLDVETYCADLMNLIIKDDSELFILEDDNDKPIGYMGVECFNNPIGEGKMANEHYWFISEKSSGRGAMLLMAAVKLWARHKNCRHLLMSASTLASDMHDKVCKFYERIGMIKFETTFIQEI